MVIKPIRVCILFYKLWQNGLGRLYTCVSLFNQLFAVLLEVILRKNGSIFNHRHLLLLFLEGNVIIYHVITYDPKSEKNVRKFYFGCHGNQFLQFKVIFRKNPEIFKDCLAIFH